MPGQPALQFADDALGQEYFRAYDHLLSHWPTAPEQTDIPTSFGTTHVLSTGRAEAPPLVLFHGINSTSAFWYPIVGALSERYRIHAVDIVGDPGRSVHNGNPVTGFDDLVDWATQVLDGLGTTTVDVCGHSLGGHLALRLALAHPERLRRLALLDPARCFAEVRPSFLLRLATRPRRPSYDRARADLFRALRVRGPADEAYIDLAARGASHFPSLPPANPQRPRASELRRLHTPTLLAIADDSEVNNPRRETRAAARFAPVVTTEVLTGVGHGLISEAPEQTSTLIRTFLGAPEQSR